MCDASEQKYGLKSRFEGIVDPHSDKLVAQLAENLALDHEPGF
jgi:hypothetical protein